MDDWGAAPAMRSLSWIYSCVCSFVIGVVRQRITLRCRTTPMTNEQTHEYIQERLRIAGAAPQSSIFSSKAMDTAYLNSMGIPRVINLLCDYALINLFV